MTGPAYFAAMQDYIDSVRGKYARHVHTVTLNDLARDAEIDNGPTDYHKPSYAKEYREANREAIRQRDRERYHRLKGER